MKRFFALALILLVCGSWCRAGVWTEDFSGDLSKWTITTAGGSTMAISAGTLYMNSPRVGGSGANSEASGKPNDSFFDSWVQTLPYRVEFDFKIPDTNNHWFFVYGDARAMTVIDYNDDFTYRASGGNTKIMDLATGQWYSMRYEVFPAAGSFDIYVDGVKKATAGFLNEAWGPFTIGDRPSGSDDFGSAYWDNFRITTNIPEPATLMLLGGGLALLRSRRRRPK